MENELFTRHRWITARPTFRLVDLLEQSVEYDMCWKLPYHVLSLSLTEDGHDPSWVEVDGRRTLLSAGALYFTAALTPRRIRYTAANRHMGIHFRYELFPGVDALSGVRGYFRVKDPGGVLAEKVKAVFDDLDPVRRYALAESVALEAMRPFWPARPALDLLRIAPYADALRAVADTLTAQIGVHDLAERMGFQGSHFARTFRTLLGMRPKVWLEQALFDRAISLLADRRRTIREIAYSLEFSDEFHFSRFIKRRCGQTPSQLRTRFDG